MKKWEKFSLLSILLMATCACSRDLVPDSVLEGLHKPEISSLSPAAVRVNGAGFCLSAGMPARFDGKSQYVLYINDEKVGRAQAYSADDHASWRADWLVPLQLLQRLLSSAVSGSAFIVRITGIDEQYDISGDFDRYRNYVSEPKTIDISLGETRFSQAKRLFPEWARSREPVIRCDPLGNIYLAWPEKIDDVYQAFFSFSADGGETWSPALSVSRSQLQADQIDLAADGAGRVFMAWRAKDQQGGSDIYFCRSLDGGATWSAPASMDAPVLFAETPSLQVSDHGDVFLAWRHWNYPEIPDVYLAVSRDLGASWNKRVIPLPTVFGNWRPLLGCQAGGRVCLLVGRNAMSSHLVLDLHSSPDYGKTWQLETASVGEAFQNEQHPLLRFGAQGEFFVVWGGETGTIPIDGAVLWNYFLRRESAGNWAAIQSLRGQWLSERSHAALAVSAGSVEVAAIARGCLFLTRSPDGGRTWPVPETVAGSEGLDAADWPDMVGHASGKTFLVFVRKSSPAEDGGELYLTSFD